MNLVGSGDGTVGGDKPEFWAVVHWLMKTGGSKLKRFEEAMNNGTKTDPKTAKKKPDRKFFF